MPPKVEVMKLTSANLLPPAKDKCQVCAVAHEPHFPHNRDSLFYQTKFQLDNGVWPTWADAMAHCSPEMKAHFETHLKAKGVEIGTVHNGQN